MAIPVYIISGFLGSGKTTLLNHILNTNNNNLKCAVIINDFGDVAIDGKLIDLSGVPIKEVAGGCICCSLRPQLTEAVRTIASSNRFDILLIETTGIALPAEIGKDIDAPKNVCDVYNAGIIGIVDAVLYHRLPEHNLFMINRQLLESTLVIINKCDLLGDDMMIEVKEKLQSVLSGGIKILSTSFGKITVDEFPYQKNNKVDDSCTLTQQKSIANNHKYHQYTFTTDRTLQLKALEDLIKIYEDVVLRVKGSVMTSEGKKLVQYSTSGFIVSTSENNLPDKLVVIFRDETEKTEQFKNSLNDIMAF